MSSCQEISTRHKKTSYLRVTILKTTKITLIAGNMYVLQSRDPLGNRIRIRAITYVLRPPDSLVPPVEIIVSAPDADVV